MNLDVYLGEDVRVGGGGGVSVVNITPQCIVYASAATNH